MWRDEFRAAEELKAAVSFQSQSMVECARWTVLERKWRELVQVWAREKREHRAQHCWLLLSSF